MIMKKYFLSLGLIMAAMLTLTNCTEQIDAPVEPAKVPFEIIASTVETKTAAGDNLSTVWTEGDALNVFHVVSGKTEYQNDGKFELSGDNVFKGELSETLTEEVSYNWYAFYPYKKKIITPANTGDEDSYVNVGSSGSGEQIQTGNNSMVHISGQNYPLVGVCEDVEFFQEDPIEITMSHLTSLVEFVVKNDSDKPLIVTNISLNATEDIVGTYYIDFTDIDNVVFTSSGTNYVSSVAKLKVNEGEAIAVGATAKFYMAIKPFTAPSGQTLTLLINDCEVEKTLSADLTFTAGKIKTINCSYTVPESALVGIAGIKAAADAAGSEGGTFVADVENAVVTYVNGKNAFIQDETAGILIFANNHGLNVGDVLTGRISGSVKIYSGLREITAFTSSATVTTTDDIPVTTLTIDQLNTDFDEYENMRVKLVDVEVTENYNFTKGGASITYYKKNSSVTGLDIYNLVDVIGYPGKYNTAKQFNVWESPEVKGATKTTFSGFSAELNVAVGASVPNKATASSGATVSYVSANDAVATVDEEGNITGVSAGTTTITASVVEYNGYPAASVTCNVTVTSDAPAAKYYVKVKEAPADWSGKYLIVFGNAAHATLSNKDLLATVSNLTITEDAILATNLLNDATFTVEKSGDSYTMKYPDGVTYFAPAHNSSSSSSSAFSLSFNFTDNGIEIGGYLTAKQNTYYLYNNQNKYFRCYTSKTNNDGTLTANYWLPELYKLED